MKTNGTQTVSVHVSLLLISLLITANCLAQPEYDFRNAVKISGTDKQVGAKYRFPNVRPATDAIVTITAITGGLTLKELDGTSSGYQEAFQPVIQVPGNSNGYIEFNIAFVLAGTSIPSIMSEVPITPIDIDGNSSISEFDMISTGLGYYLDFNMLGGELGVTIPSVGWVQGINSGGVDYPGVDTSAEDVMFTVVNAAISSFTFRTGADNRSGSSQQRLRSVYFKRFTYANSFLAQPVLLTFQGNEKNSKVELQWEISRDNNLSKVVVEKAASPSQFSSIGEVWMNTETISQYSFRFTDNNALNGKTYYRLKMVGMNGGVEYSNILAFQSGDAVPNPFKVYPSALQSSATINIKSEKSGNALFQLMDYAGRVVMQRVVTIREGNNNVIVNNLNNINPGSYIALLKTNDQKVYNQKVIKQ